MKGGIKAGKLQLIQYSTYSTHKNPDGKTVQKVDDGFWKDLQAVLRILITLIQIRTRIRILLFTLMRIRNLFFILMRIQNQLSTILRIRIQLP